MKPVLLDAGVIVALLDRSERYHEACVEAIDALTAPLITCEAVIAEACFLLRRLPGAKEAVIENVVSGVFKIAFSLDEQAEHVKRILRTYRDRAIDLADACLVQIATANGTGHILTLDRDFEVYRWGKKRPFELIIPLK